MSKEELFQKLMRIYRSSFNMEEPYEFGGNTYDAYGFCDITSAKYVLVKKAQLWRAICYEHAFFKTVDCLTKDDIDNFSSAVCRDIEPQLVRKGQPCMEKDHMYSYVTGIFICGGGVSEEVKKAVKKAHYYKNYRLSIRGYCEMRILVVDLANGKLIGNRAARSLIKDYKKLI